MRQKWITLISIFAFAQFANAGVVQNICEKRTGIKVVPLSYRDGEGNRKKIASLDTGKNSFLKYIKDSASKNQLGEARMAKAAIEGNKQFIPESQYKSLFLKFASTENKIKDPAGYRSTLVKLIEDLLPEDFKKLSWFLNLKDKRLSATNLRPADKSEINEVYGAVARLTPSSSGKFQIEIIFSNNDSEALPYLIPLIVHELQHASNFEKRIDLFEKRQELGEFAILDEAVAFDIQMQTYVDLAGKYPEIFCNWLYPSWSYGDVMIPLSWSMSAMEEALSDGTFLPRYASQGSFKKETYLLNESKTDLRDDIRAKIKKMNLKFVK